MTHKEKQQIIDRFKNIVELVDSLREDIDTMLEAHNDNQMRSATELDSASTHIFHAYMAWEQSESE